MIARLFASAALLLSLSATAAQADTVKFTFATTNGPKDFSSQAIVRWQQAMKERSGGELDMTFISGGALGGDQELLQQLATNEIQLHVAGPVIVHKLLKQYQCMEAEFVYRDEDHGYRVWTGPLGDEVNKALEDQYGITMVGVGLRGARQLTANKAINSPADLAGVKVRVTNPLRSQVFEALGALPAPLSISELYGALRQGVFDAQENPIPTIWGNKFYEVQDHVNLTSHVISYYIVSANKGFVEGLSGEHRKVFDETLGEAMGWLNQKVRDDTAALLKTMQDGGLSVIKPDVTAFQQIAAPVVEAYAAENCRPGLLEDIRKVQ
ncbi:TRAP transporter substrate-binding protein [Pelagibius sp.]|uniref:TRAP transporter substrate-binding protein n=1 Tax=Pelagibius sp. TaxID=1931238 RepID=UPI00261AD8CF|nr:TRAP transporter substrate-binding protein [Pelagibius sp.]